MHGLSLAQTEFLVADRLSWIRFCGLGQAKGSTPLSLYENASVIGM